MSIITYVIKSRSDSVYTPFSSVTAVVITSLMSSRRADTLTPVSLYLKVRDHYSDPVLLESNDFRSIEDCFSFLGVESIGGVEVRQGRIRLWYPDGTQETSLATDMNSVPDAVG